MYGSNKKMLRSGIHNMSYKYIKILTLASIYFWIEGLVVVSYLYLKFFCSFDFSLVGVYCFHNKRSKVSWVWFVFKCSSSVIFMTEDNTWCKLYGRPGKRVVYNTWWNSMFLAILLHTKSTKCTDRCPQSSHACS